VQDPKEDQMVKVINGGGVGMKVGDLVRTIEDWDRIGLVIHTYLERKHPEAKIKWADGAIEIWCVKDLVLS